MIIVCTYSVYMTTPHAHLSIKTNQSNHQADKHSRNFIALSDYSIDDNHCNTRFYNFSDINVALPKHKRRMHRLVVRIQYIHVDGPAVAFDVVVHGNLEHFGSQIPRRSAQICNQSITVNGLIRLRKHTTFINLLSYVVHMLSIVVSNT